MPDASVPALGKVNKPTLIVAGLAATGAAIYAYVKNKKAKAAAASTAASGYGYGGYAYGGGYGYGAGLSQQYAYGGAGGGYGTSGYPATGYGVGTPPSGTTQVAATNAQWAQYAQSFLVSQGYDSQTVSVALGAYITGHNVGANESVVEAAIAFEGYPPVAGPNNMPPSINTSGANQGQPSGSSVTGGNVMKVAGAISNLQVRKKTATSFTVGWNPAQGATQGYKYDTTGGGVNKPGSTHGTSATVSGLKKGQTYNFGIQALPGGPGNNIHITL